MPAGRITKECEHSNPVLSEFHRILWCGIYMNRIFVASASDIRFFCLCVESTWLRHVLCVGFVPGLNPGLYKIVWLTPHRICVRKIECGIRHTGRRDISTHPLPLKAKSRGYHKDGRSATTNSRGRLRHERRHPLDGRLVCAHQGQEYRRNRNFFSILCLLFSCLFLFVRLLHGAALHSWCGFCEGMRGAKKASYGCGV